MATLHVRNVPDRLYRRIHRLADRENRSLSAEVIDLLTDALGRREARESTADLLGRVRRRRITLPAGAPDSVYLLREERRR